MDAVEKGNLTALIARSADFYGPEIKGNSVLTEAVFKPLSEGKKANWLGRTDKVHSFTYTPDAAKATAILGNSLSAYNQVWHLPTAKNPLTGEEWVEHIASALEQKAKIQSAPSWLVRIMGIFDPFMKEMSEMMYQFEQDYRFVSDKFETAFDFKPTPYLKGIKEVVQKDYGF